MFKNSKLNDRYSKYLNSEPSKHDFLMTIEHYDLVEIVKELDNNIPYVPAGSVQQLAALEAIWQPLKNEFKELVEKDIAGFNAICREAKLEKITVR
jgi:formiminotetrahydrofolate cyclodeaminase